MERGTVEIQKKQSGNLTIYTVYYSSSLLSGAAEKLLSFRKYFSLQKKVYKEIVSEFGKPDIVHVHVPMKAGLFAQYLKRNFEIPYVVTEHWAGYTRECKPNIYDLGKTFIKLNNLVLKGAQLLLPVSEDLGMTIFKNFIPVKYEVVPNVVNTTIFFPGERKVSPTLKLIHISNMDYQKNMEDVIKALAGWKKKGGVFELNCYGLSNAGIETVVKDHSLEGQVFFHGEVPQTILAKAMQQADALILYSRYETFGCVLIEANTCGVPVIVSDLPVFHEIVMENFNGVFVEGENPESLAKVFEEFSQKKDSFRRADIAAFAKRKYGYDTVGRQILSIYEKIIK